MFALLTTCTRFHSVRALLSEGKVRHFRYVKVSGADSQRLTGSRGRNMRAHRLSLLRVVVLAAAVAGTSACQAPTALAEPEEQKKKKERPVEAFVDCLLRFDPSGVMYDKCL
jgi:hypothetical protein